MIILMKNENFFRFYDNNSNPITSKDLYNKNIKYKIIESKDLKFYLYDSLYLDPNIRFKQFLDLILQHWNIYDEIFGSAINFKSLEPIANKFKNIKRVKYDKINEPVLYFIWKINTIKINNYENPTEMPPSMNPDNIIYNLNLKTMLPMIIYNNKEIKSINDIDEKILLGLKIVVDPIYQNNIYLPNEFIDKEFKIEKISKLEFFPKINLVPMTIERILYSLFRYLMGIEVLQYKDLDIEDETNLIKKQSLNDLLKNAGIKEIDKDDDIWNNKKNKRRLIIK